MKPLQSKPSVVVPPQTYGVPWTLSAARTAVAARSFSAYDTEPSGRVIGIRPPPDDGAPADGAPETARAALGSAAACPSRAEASRERSTCARCTTWTPRARWLSASGTSAASPAGEAIAGTVAAVATRGNGEVEQAFFRQVLRENAIGLIYGTINTRRVEPPALPRALPTVLLNCYLADNSLPAIVPNEVLGGLTATQRLLDAGHKRIGYINGEPWMDASRDRLRGYRRALAGADIAFDAALVRNGNWEPTAGYAGTQALMQLAAPPTAIFCANDMMALGCYEALGELGRRIPEDVAVIGYDDREVARHLHPPLTTVVLPHYAMGIDAAECLFDIAAGHTVQPRIKVEGQLVERRSV